MSTPSIKELRQARAREGQRSPKWLRWLAVAAGLFVLYVVIGFFVAPPIVRSQLEKRLSGELKREVRVAKVALNPLTLSGAIEGFAIRERDGKGDFVSWKRAFANFDSWSLFLGGFTFDEVMLEGAYARVAVDRQGKLNFADLLTLLQSAEKPAAASKSEPRTLHVRRLEVSAAKLDYSEDLETHPFATTVGPVTFSLREFHTGGKNDAPGNFAATTEAGETIGWRGTVAVAPLRSEGEVSLGNILLKKYMPYVERFAKFAITDGVLAVKGRYELVFAQDKPTLRLREGVVALKTFKLGAPGAEEPAVALESLELTGVAADSAANSAAVSSVALKGGRVVVTRDAGGIDLLRLIEPKAGALPAGGSVANGVGSTSGGGNVTPAIDAKLGELAVAGLTVVVNDTTTPRPARQEIEVVSLNVKDVSLAQLAKTSPVALNAKLAGGGVLTISGALAPQPLKGELMIALENAPLAPVSPYAEMFVNARIASGAVSTKARVLLDTPAGAAVPAVTANAEASVDDFAIIESEGPEEVARWKKLSLRGIEAATAPSLKVLVADVEWTEPSGRVVMGADGKLNLADLLRTPASGVDAGGAAPGVAFKPAGASSAPSAASGVAGGGAFIAVDRFTLSNAAFLFLDRSVQPEVKVALNQLSGTVAGLSSANLARADVDLRGKVDGVAPVSIRGQINPLAGEAFTDLKVDFRGIDLRPTGPYVAKYAGYALERGALTLDVKVKLAQRRMDSTTVVTLDPFMLGDVSNSPEATKLPLKLGLAILRDRSGRIALPPVDVDGSLDDPNFRIGRVVWYAIGNIFAKAATSPFSLLGSMFGGGKKSEELAFQEFAPGSAELTEDSVRKLDVLSKALTERPDLRIDVAGGFGAAADAPALRERALEKGIRAALWEEQRKSAGPGAVVPPPEQTTLTPEASARVIGEFYRAAFEPEEDEAPGDVAEKKTEAEAGETKEKKKSFSPAVRMFRRGGAPVATGKNAPKAPPPRSYNTATAGATAPGASTARGASQPAATPPGPTVEEMRAKLLAAISIDENLLRELAGERAQRVRAYFVEAGQIDAGRISLAGETTKGPRVDLQLK